MEKFFEQLKSVVNPAVLVKYTEKTTMKIFHHLLKNLKNDSELKKG